MQYVPDLDLRSYNLILPGQENTERDKHATNAAITTAIRAVLESGREKGVAVIPTFAF